MNSQIHRALKPGAIFTQRVTQYPTVSEQRIDLLRNWVISSDQNWFKSIYDGGGAFARWSDMGKICGMPADEISRALDELTFYAKLLHSGSTSSVRLSPVKNVWFGDTLVDAETSLMFAQWAAEALDEDGSKVTGNGYHVSGLVDPLSYPLDYSCAYLFVNPTRSPEESLTAPVQSAPTHSIHLLQKSLGKRVYLPADPSEWTASKNYSMLPTDFHVNKEGKTQITSYINNLHPVKHKRLYPLIARIFAALVPALEQTLTDILHPVYANNVSEPSEWYAYDGTCPEPHKLSRVNGESHHFWSMKKERNRMMTERAYERWERAKTWVGPKPRPFVAPSRPISPYSLCGRKVQAVVRMDNLVIHPESPASVATEWQVQGLSNERIMATGVYFYSVENIAPGSSISFREAVCGSFTDKYNFDLEVLSKAYGLEIDPTNTNSENLTISKVLGTLEVQQGRCLVFPNTYQSRFVDMKLKDKSKPGVCKMLQFFYVDPATRVPSSAMVPPRQQGWSNNAAMQPMSPEHAKAVREQMSDERNACNRMASERLFEPQILSGLGKPLSLSQ
ncbi:hypothetical protein LPJ59_001211 [Coemansia sp. RSA 2399]|nr:hypothetical protein LPJ59_001211 [Coemansia sp. RSA 2399]